MIKYGILDVETSIKNRGDFSIGNFEASPFHPANQIVALGYKEYGSNIRTLYYTDYDLTKFSVHRDILLVGLNFKFDLLHLMRYPHWREWLWTGRIWCCALAEFVLSGQSHIYPSLDELAIKYGGTVKPDKIKEYWEAGIDTEDIPKDELLDYLNGDISNTEIVFLGQIKEARRRGLFPLLMMEMESLIATTEMEYNGLPFDKVGAAQKVKELQKELEVIEAEIIEVMAKHLPKMPVSDITPGSNDQLSTVLFGGEYKYEGRETVNDANGNPYIFKSGKKKGTIKTKKCVYTETTEGLNLSPLPEWSTKKAGTYQTNESVLGKIKNPFAKRVLGWRELAKDINTYYVGYSKLVWPDGCIHGKIDHVRVPTGRFNSSSPNLQNLSGEE